MQGERLLDILTEIRDQQKRQIVNFERALADHQQALAQQHRVKLYIISAFLLPWVLVAALCGLLFLERMY